ncbi:MAG TPA: sigma-70 family RNA polymerase sigma factor, partial [Polyangiaceae bacterium]|nr:sigma-70 family RNA polymerase sigma factor [Polyangiaceae bacterium]
MSRDDVGPGRVRPSPSDRLPPARRFDTTRWSLVLRAGEPGGKQALSELFRAYWQPVRMFIQNHGVSAEDAADVTQELFERLLVRNDLARVDRNRGQFRSWLRTCARNHLYNWLAHRRCARVGGRAVHVSVESQCEALHSSAQTPDRLFDRNWALTLLDRALVRLRRRYERVQRLALFEALAPGPRSQAAELNDVQWAARLGTSAGAIKVERHRMNQRFQECLRAEVA